MLREKSYENPNPRKHFITDLLEVVNKIEQDPKHYIIILIDANESIGDDECSMNRLFSESTLVDAFTKISNEDCNTPSYARGSKRIDFILTSYKLLLFITQAGYLPFFKYNMESDHRGCCIDLNNKLLDNIVENK